MFLRLAVVVTTALFLPHAFGQSVLLNPTGSQTVTQPQTSTPITTTLSVNSLNNVINAAQMNWSQTVSVSAGGTSVTVTPCPLGVNGANPNYHIYLSGGGNPAET